MTGAHSSLDGHLPYLQDMYLLGGRGYDGYDGPAHGGLGPGVGVLECWSRIEDGSQQVGVGLPFSILSSLQTIITLNSFLIGSNGVIDHPQPP